MVPGGRVDVALPVDVPLAELVPELLRHGQANLPADRDPGPVSAWSLQRFGQAALDLGATPAALSLLDGEVLYLRPRQAELPELTFDDVADAVATATTRSTRRWQQADTRHAGLAGALAALAATAAILLGSGPSWLVPASVAGVIVVALVIAGAVISRAFGDARSARIPAYAAVPFAALAGAMAFGGDATPGRFGALSVLGAGAAAIVVAVLAALAVADGVPWLAGLGVAALVPMAIAALDVATGIGTAGGAALAVVIGLGLTQLVPLLAMRMAEMPQPVIPVTTEDVRRDTTTVPGAEVLRRAVVADAYVTSLVGAAALVIGGGQVLLVRVHDTGADWLVAVVAAATVLRARAFAGWLQRAFLLLAAGVGGGLLAVSLVLDRPGLTQRFLLVVPLLLAVAALLVVVALRGAGPRVSPVWRRATDILDALVVVSILPVALGVLGIYGYVRGLSG